jgi:hypothetical protein
VSEMIRLIGYTAGGLPGSRILDRLTIPVSDDTVLRIVKASTKARRRSSPAPWRR